MRVTLDTNVFGPVADPSAYPNCADQKSCIALQERIKSKDISAYISQASLSLEALCHEQRIDEFFRQWADKKSVVVPPLPNHKRIHIVDKCLALGMQVLRVHNIALGEFVPIPAEAWAEDNYFPIEQRHERIEIFAHAFKSHGREKLIQLGANLVLAHGIDTSAIPRFIDERPEEYFWLNGIVKEFDDPRMFSTRKAFSRHVQAIISEWCDRDILASHYGYGNDYFCTFDSARNSGRSAIFHPENRAVLMRDFGVVIVDPASMIKMI